MTEKRTYPISRTLTHPITGAAIGGGGAALLGHLSGRKKHRAALAALGAFLGGGGTYLDRHLQAKGLRQALRSKSKVYTREEKRMLLRGIDTSKWSKKPKTVTQMAVSPLPVGVLNAAIGGALAGPAGAVSEGTRAALETAIARYAGARALRGRMTTGKGMFAQEKALARELEYLRRKRK